MARSAEAGRPVRIVHLITELNVGGAELMLARLLESSDRTQLDNVVISLERGGVVADRIAAAGVATYDLGLTAGSLNPRGLWRLVMLLHRLKPDVLQTWLYHADFAGLLAGFVLREPRLVWNIRCAELEPSEYSWTLTRLLQVLAVASRRPAVVIANSTAGRMAHERLGYHPRRWEIIPNGFDTQLFRPAAEARTDVRRELGISPDALLVGHVGRVHPMKAHDTLLRAAARVASTIDNVQVVLVGRNTESDPGLTHLAQSLGLAGRLHRLGERGDTSRLIGAFDVAVSSSVHSEGFPNAVGEAMACGIPCVVTDVGDSAALVADCGIVVPPGNAALLSDAVVTLLKMNPVDRQAIGMAGRQRIVNEFSIARVAKRYLDFYVEIAGTRCAA